MYAYNRMYRHYSSYIGSLVFENLFKFTYYCDAYHGYSTEMVELYLYHWQDSPLIEWTSKCKKKAKGKNKQEVAVLGGQILNVRFNDDYVCMQTTCEENYSGN